MANFVKIDQYNIVRDVIVIDNKNCDDKEFPASEPIGQAFIASLGLDGEWKQTSYNENFRGKYAGIGYTWDGTNFIPPVITGV